MREGDNLDHRRVRPGGRCLKANAECQANPVINEQLATGELHGRLST
jgi:hypothetical protein